MYQAATALELEPIGQAPELPFALRMDELPWDELTRKRAEQFIGRVTMGEVVVEPVEEAPNVSLRKSLHRAKEGDEEASASAKLNVRTAVVEAFIKAGIIIPVETEINESGSRQQHGQTVLNVNANALLGKVAKKHSGMMAITKSETVNEHRHDDALRAGAFEDYYQLICSLVPAEEEVPFTIATEEAGYFGDTMSLAFQLIGSDDETSHVESAFVAGVSEKGASRHDIETLRQIYMAAGFDAQNWQPLDFHRTPLMIPKERLPYGVASMVEVFDTFASQVTGKELFFGQANQSGSYETFAEESRRRIAELDDLVDGVFAEMLRLSSSFKIDSDATEMLTELIRVRGTEHAVDNHAIDPSVLGPKAAENIYLARQYTSAGNAHMAHLALQAAKATAIVTMCGMTKKMEESMEEILHNVTDLDAYRKKKSERAEEAEIPDYITCVNKDCRKTSPKTSVVHADRWECPHCQYAVDICTSKEIVRLRKIVEQAFVRSQSKIAA